MILLNPGPVTLSARVRAALGATDMCHREADFAEMMLRIKGSLSAVYGEPTKNYDAIVLTGSGTGAVEAMIASLVPAKAKLLIVENGIYGARMSEMARRHGKAHQSLAHEWQDGLDLARIETALKDPAITHVGVIHHETTTGRLNDLDGLGALCTRLNKPMLLDAVSSFGAEEIKWDAWNVWAAAATANKCLHGAPGLSFVMAPERALKEGNKQVASLYLDLHAYHAAQRDGFSPFTQATNVALALEAALAEFDEAGGQAARLALYNKRSEAVRACLKDLGIAMFIPALESASMLSSFKLPKNMSYDALHDAMRARNFVIYAGQGGLARDIFRIAVMGDIGESDMMQLLRAFREILKA